MSRDRDGPEIAHQSLLYPAGASHAVHDFPSHEENAEGYLLEGASVEWFLERYVPNPVDHRNVYFAPLFRDVTASRSLARLRSNLALLARDLSELPPATVLTAGFDPLRDEGPEYADRLELAGVPVEHHEYEGMIHGFVYLLDQLAAARDGLETVSEELRTALQ